MILSNKIPVIKGVFFAAVLALSLSGCGLIYTNVRMPRAYRSATPSDVKSSPSDPAVSGTACNTAVLFLFAWGDASYAAAAEDALKNRPDAFLYDVKADMKVTSILGLYARTCTLLTGKATQLLPK